MDAFLSCFACGEKSSAVVKFIYIEGNSIEESLSNWSWGN